MYIDIYIYMYTYTSMSHFKIIPVDASSSCLKQHRDLISVLFSACIFHRCITINTCDPWGGNEQ